MADEEEQNDEEKKQPEKKRLSKGKKIGIIAAIVVILLAIVVTIFLLVPMPLTDSDGDGILNRNDAFPNDPNEQYDSDEDGIGDNADFLPNDPNAWVDSDKDGVGDNADALPFNPTQVNDKDGDGYGDNPEGTDADEFPYDPNEWIDSDGDWIGDNADFYDQGNGKIYCKITYYNGDSSPDGAGGLAGELDPYFIIAFDVDGDEEYDYSYTSEVYGETDELFDPFSKTLDIPDDIQYVWVKVVALDSDPDLSDLIDIVGDSSLYNCPIVQYDTSSGVYYYISDGQDDEVDDEINVEIHFEISVTG